MILISIALGLLSMVAYALANVYSKPLSQRLGAPQTLFLRGITIAVLLAIPSMANASKLGDAKVVLATIALGIVGYLPVLAFTHAIRESRIGIVAPIAGTSPLVTVLLSFIFLGVLLSGGQWVALVVIVLANIVVSIDFKNLRNSDVISKASGIPYALIAALGWGVFFFALVYAARALSAWQAAWLCEVGVTIAAGAHLFITKQKILFKEASNKLVMFNGALISVGTVAYTIGAKNYNVGIVAALSNSTALLALILGFLLYKERFSRREVAALLTMVVGVVILTVL
ncbi:MAG: putative rane protein [Candidatus Saccharibacteria bacterium]|nr:putative rane protein [Candidatus Saccharibacteria bacterium]